LRVGWRLVLLLLGACTQVYDIDPTALAPSDTDGDTVPDEVDTCIETPNPGDAQLDSDTDGLGDVCDACPLLPSANQHDEDRDGIGDECDPCPALPDFGDDLDADGIGDLCDPDHRASVRRLFDPFTSIEPHYTIAGTAWATSGDAAAPTARLGANERGLEARDVKVSGDQWWVSVGLHSESAWNDDRHGIVMRDASGTPRWTCEVVCTGDKCIVSYGGAVFGSYSTSSPVPEVVLRFHVRHSAGTTTLVCMLVPGATQFASFSSNAVAEELWPSFITQPTTELRYVEVLE
jgi:hypothetical protein